MKQIIPNETTVKNSEDGKYIEITFSTDSGDGVSINLLQGQVALLVSRLQKEIVPGSAVPIDKNSFRPGQTIAIQGYQMQKHHSGAKRLIFHVDLPDEKRHVTIPLELTSDDVLALIRDLNER